LAFFLNGLWKGLVVVTFFPTNGVLFFFGTLAFGAYSIRFFHSFGHPSVFHHSFKKRFKKGSFNTTFTVDKWFFYNPRWNRSSTEQNRSASIWYSRLVLSFRRISNSSSLSKEGIWPHLS